MLGLAVVLKNMLDPQVNVCILYIAPLAGQMVMLFTLQLFKSASVSSV